MESSNNNLKQCSQEPDISGAQANVFRQPFFHSFSKLCTHVWEEVMYDQNIPRAT